ncbi:MAG: DUF485 domain-containing protein [Thiotrichaceae bacterium]|nr:DUF485 domain-containing protein [Thiotrichaceae bacterium]
MQPDMVSKVKQHPKYRELLAKRTVFSWILTFIMCAIYYGFILLVAFRKDVLKTPIADNSIITVGIPLGVLVILSAFILTGIYTWRANGTFDELTREIKKDVQ